MAGRYYRAVFDEVAVSAQQDFFEVLAATGKLIEVVEFGLSQSTELGDAAEEQLHIKETRGIGTVTSGSGGSTATPQPEDDGDSACGATVEINNTTKMVVGTGTLEQQGSHNWNVRQSYRHVYPEAARPQITPGNRWALGLYTTPADAITASGYVVLKEIGS